MVSKVFVFLLALLVALSAAAPTQYTMRYGKHDLRRGRDAGGKHRRVGAGSPDAAELSKLVRRRARKVARLRATRVARERRVRAGRL